MRPLKLTMQAFGPYAGTEIIDFTELENRTMFVISGKTGSGKTTIFDGISYAIYGKASGDDRHGPDLRSQFANEDVLTEVSLQFSLRGKNYYIKRAPQQEKKKERGDGVRTISAQAELYMMEQDGEQKLIASNVRDVDEKIKEIMLIDSNQFRQILMIPQGEFRKLLTSDSKDKEVILQRLFHTEVYKRVEERLKEEAKNLEKAVAKETEDRNHWIRKITALHNEELKTLLEEESDNDTVIYPLLLDEILQMTTQLETLNQEVQVKEKERDVLQQKLYEAETIVKQLKQKSELEANKAALENKKEVIAGKEIEINLAGKAALLSKQEELCHRLKRELDGYQADLIKRENRISELSNLLKEKAEAYIQEKEREDERKAAQSEVHKLQQMKDEVQSFAVLQTEVKGLEKHLGQLVEEKKNSEESLIKTEGDIKSLTEERQVLEKTDVLLLENTRNIEVLDSEIEYITKFEHQLQRYHEHRILLDKRKGQFQQAELVLQDARSLLEELEHKWLHGQASILANQLHDGEECPVCGSEHHPKPAKVGVGDIPNEVDLKAAKEQVSYLEKEKAKAESALFEVQSLITTMEQTLGELRGEILKKRSDFADDQVENIKQFIQQQRSELIQKQKQLQQDLEVLEKVKVNLKKYEEKLTADREHLTGISEKVNEVTVTFTEKNTNLTGIKDRIPEELRSIQGFEKQWKQAVQLQEHLQRRYEEAQQMYQETKEKHGNEESAFFTVKSHMLEKERELKNEKEAFVEQMTAQGFENYRSYDSAKRSDEQIKQLDKEISEYREDVRSVTDRLNEITLALKDVKEPDIEGLQTVMKEVLKQISSLHDQIRELYMKKRDNEEIRDCILKINEDIKALEVRYKLVGELSDISKGQNTKRITFERYVLAAFLDDILREANGRLIKMTNGRYEMRRKTDRSKGNVQSGLELLVFDQYTGQERHVKTLSGGESFKAALSLALGLADVVQNYAGGVSLETMFIDEGFGTLDPESLDQAIEALIDIQSSGRLVGIISHVPELKERIDARLEVTATQMGSMTEFHFMNG